MRAWVARRREDGALLQEPAQIKSGIAPYELLVVDVTDQGQRRPSKVARLVSLGDRRAVAELVAPKLVWLEGWKLVLSGIERLQGRLGLKQVSQSWVCELVPPSFAIGFKITHTYVEGIQLPRRALRDTGKTSGRIKVGDSLIKSLGRHTPLAELIHYEPDGHKDSMAHLADCHLEWMSEDRFELGGLCIRAPFEDRPEHLLRDGWLCEFDIELPDLNRAQKRLLGPVH